MTFVISFIDRETGETKYINGNIAVIRWITSTEIGVTKLDGSLARFSFKEDENLQINRK